MLDLGKEAIQVLVIKYAKSLRDDPIKKYSRATVDNRISTLFYFFENNDVELNKRKIRRYYPPDESIKDDKLYSEEQIRKILSVCDLRTKAMIYLMLSSGVRVGSLHSMRIEDLIPVTYQGQELYKVRVYARTRDEYYSFVTSEARSEGIDPYLDYRRRCLETLKDESPLFRRQFNRFSINRPYPLSQEAVMKSIDNAIKRAGVKSSKIRCSHSFRKAFLSLAERSGMRSINVKMLMGHDIGVSGHYYRPAESDILEDYMIHAADALTIDPTQRLKIRVQELETIKDQEIALLKKRLEIVEEFSDGYYQAAKASHDYIVTTVNGGIKGSNKKYYTTFKNTPKTCKYFDSRMCASWNGRRLADNQAGVSCGGTHTAYASQILVGIL